MTPQDIHVSSSRSCNVYKYQRDNMKPLIEKIDPKELFKTNKTSLASKLEAYLYSRMAWPEYTTCFRAQSA